MCIGCKFGLQMALLALLVNVANSWWFSHHQLAPLAMVINLSTRWGHLHWFELWPPGRATCIATLPMIVVLTSSVVIFISQSHIS